jgi:hypothetical protein
MRARKYPDVKGKVVKSIRESQSDYGIDIVVEFTDKTAMTWTVRPRAVVEPELLGWKTGNGKTLRRYPALTTRD